jgi:hypothetical protein
VEKESTGVNASLSGLLPAEWTAKRRRKKAWRRRGGGYGGEDDTPTGCGDGEEDLAEEADVGDDGEKDLPRELAEPPPRELAATLGPDVSLGFSSGLHRCKPGCQTGYGEYFCVTGWAGKLQVFTLIYTGLPKEASWEYAQGVGREI